MDKRRLLDLTNSPEPYSTVGGALLRKGQIKELQWSGRFRSKADDERGPFSIAFRWFSIGLYPFTSCMLQQHVPSLIESLFQHIT